jgi:beta-glucuronidase
MRIGIRITKTLGKKFFLNGKPLYLKGCGMEPAVDRRAPACDPGTLVRSAAALGALNADSLRLGTAPGTEEMLELADEQGICAVVELPAAGGGTGPEQAPADNGTDHAELVARLRHHPSVVMWNLPAGPADPDGTSLRRAAAIVKKADPTRPVSVAVGLGSGEAKNAAFADVVCLDWSIGPEAGDPASRLAAELDAIWETCKKPVIFRWDGSSPDGSPAPGRQRWMLQQCGDALDARDYLAGEHLMTVPVRDPAAAHVLTERWKKK